MYVPTAFAETDLIKLHAFIEQNGFGVLVTQVEGKPFATHLPFLLKKFAGENGTLVGHMARANPQWKDAKGQTGLAIFSGAHAYISPSWYESEHVVPTWNYAAVHASGSLEIIEEPDELLKILLDAVRFYEQPMAEPWIFDGSTPFMEKMLAQIIGFRMSIETIEGKWKLNQNHPAERRGKVIAALRKQPGENAQAIADMMQLRDSARG